MAIYTRKGDKGRTSLFDGTKTSKSDLRISAVGTIDELNSLIGVCLLFVRNKTIKTELEKIQNDLFEIGGALAYPHKMPAETIYERASEFEKIIDQLTRKMPSLSNFILPGGGKAGSHLHLARTVCRRSERRIVELSNKQNIDSEILVYLNRLSDLLFTFARFENQRDRKKEKVWRKR
ncbi:MAG: cob(I)yrinic acid a,c-diamide adenosyltransferase [Patescibacteria group bacterium]